MPHTKHSTPAGVNLDPAKNAGKGSLTEQSGSVLENVNGTKETTLAETADLMATRPNGGLRAWLQVACGFFLFFNTYGLINTFGIYQNYYTSNFSFHPSRASLIGGIQVFLVFFVTGFAGPLYDAGYTRYLVTAGAIFIVFGTMMQSFCTQYYQFILAEALCIGFGGGLVWSLAPAVLSTHFTSFYPLAVGIAASGSGIGGLILPIAFRELEPRIGFPMTVRVIGFILMATLWLPVLFLQPRMTPAAKRKPIDWAAFTDWPFVVFLAGNFLYLLGAFTPFFYIQVYAIENGIADENLSLYIVAIMNVTSGVARIIPNFITPYVGPFNMLIFTSVLTFGFAFSFEGAKTSGSLITASALYGAASGLFFALQPVVVIGLIPNPRLIGTRVGMAFSFLSFAVLASNPVAGAIQTKGGFSGVWIWTGVTTSVGTVIMVAARQLKTNGAIMLKA